MGGAVGLLETHLVAACGEVELAQGGRVAVGHVSTPAEEYQRTSIVGQGAPEHLDTTFLLQFGYFKNMFYLNQPKKDPNKNVLPLKCVFPACPWRPG